MVTQQWSDNPCPKEQDKCLLLDFEQIEDCFPEGLSVNYDASVVTVPNLQWLHDFARAIEQATTRKAIEQIAEWHEKEGWLLDEDDVPAAIRALLPDSKEQP